MPNIQADIGLPISLVMIILYNPKSLLRSMFLDRAAYSKFGPVRVLAIKGDQSRCRLQSVNCSSLYVLLVLLA